MCSTEPLHKTPEKVFLSLLPLKFNSGRPQSMPNADQCRSNLNYWFQCRSTKSKSSQNKKIVKVGQSYERIFSHFSISKWEKKQESGLYCGSPRETTLIQKPETRCNCHYTKIKHAINFYPFLSLFIYNFWKHIDQICAYYLLLIFIFMCFI